MNFDEIPKQPSQEWFGELVKRITPFLRVQAEVRLRKRHIASIDDMLQETWMHVITRWAALDFSGSGGLRRIRAYTAKVLLLQINNLLARESRRTSVSLDPGSSSDAALPAAILASTVTDACVKASRAEAATAVRDAFALLSDADREVIVLRGIEGQSNESAASELEITAIAVAKRYGRALERLRSALPESILREILDVE